MMRVNCFSHKYDITYLLYLKFKLKISVSLDSLSISLSAKEKVCSIYLFFASNPKQKLHMR